MIETQTRQETARWNPWPVSIVAFFCLAITGFSVFIAFCSRHPAELVATDYYEQELRYQGQIDRIENAQRDAAGATVTYDIRTRTIVISLPPGATAVSPGGVVKLYRPSAATMDREVKLAPDAAGLHRIDAAGLSPGLWKVRVSWSAGGRDYFLDKKVVIVSPPS